MPQHEIRVPFPLDMLGDLDTTVRFVEDTHLSQYDTPEKQRPFHGLIHAVQALKAAIHGHRSKPATEAGAAGTIEVERGHLKALFDFAQGAPGGGPAERRAVVNVAEWLDQDI